MVGVLLRSFAIGFELTIVGEGMGSIEGCMVAMQVFWGRILVLYRGLDGRMGSVVGMGCSMVVVVYWLVVAAMLLCLGWWLVRVGLGFVLLCLRGL